ncbi:MAG: tRNA (cytidine(34)-2'-O)-methyltransferase [Sphaerochaetaceae bacterium]|nr:tRNA (cytidine(34)-2'-O)-methyltransferase [Sphaerochaetaceae bacterium]
MNLHIVLFEPEIPPNTGNIARTCAVVGATLHLVGPLGFSLDQKYIRRAGLDYWPLVNLVEYESIADFMKKHEKDNLFFLTTKAHHVYSDSVYNAKETNQDIYLVFGKESAGIPEEILKQNPAKCIRIPMRKELRSLNLSNSVAIAVYEVLRQFNFPDLERDGQLHRLKWEKEE